MKRSNNSEKRYYSTDEQRDSSLNRKQNTMREYDMTTNEERKGRKILIALIIIAFVIMVLMICALLCYHKMLSAKQDPLDALINIQENAAELSDNETDYSAELSEEEPVPEEEIDPEGETAQEQEQNAYAPAEYAQQYDYQMVINRSNPLPANFIAGTGQLDVVEGSIKMESNAAAAARNMIAAARDNGFNVVPVSGYRSDEYQEYLYQRQIGRQNGNEKKAATISALPYTSEHQAGLAIDISSNGTLEQSFADTPLGSWLAQHCTEYGFIIRYTRDKERSTGVIFEPWHFRYVGSAQDAATLQNSGLSMEEFYGKTLSAEDIDPYLPYLN